MGVNDAARGGTAQALLLDAALEQIPYGFCVWSPDFRLLLWNRHWCEIYGFPPDLVHSDMTLEEIVALSSQIGNHSTQTPVEFYQSYRAELLNNRSGVQASGREITRDDRTIQTAHVYSPQLGWVVTHEDVTDELARADAIESRKQEVEQQNIRLDAAVNNISQGLCMMDVQGRLVICNEPYARIYNLPPDLVRPGTKLHDIIDHLFASGMSSPVGALQDYVVWRDAVIASREYGTILLEFNGRTIVMQHHPMKDGGWVSTHEDITEHKQNERRIRHLARHDALTDLPNRTEFLDQMEKTETSLSRGHMAAVLSIDLDHFKSVNDAFGHTVGDEVIKRAAARLKRTSRDTDLLARLNGDAFALLLRPVQDIGDAARVADRIIRNLSAPMHIGDEMIAIGASVGIAVGPGDGVQTDTLIKNAELALLKAKSEGRSTYHFFEPEMDALLQKRRVIERGLRLALQRQELRLVYQPLLGLAANRVTCVEALLRWDHGGRTISPAEFIPIAEETGLIAPIGEWVLREALKVAATWPDTVRVAVNLSPVQFKGRDLVSMVRSALDDVGLGADRLELEITEMLLLAKNETTLAALHQLRAMGVRISIDDFGTGYASLSYLRSFPFDKIKIDRSFIADLTTDSQAIVQAVIGLGKSLGMTVTTEGVETAEQMALVRLHGATEVQGYFFAQPLAADALADLLRADDAQGRQI